MRTIQEENQYQSNAWAVLIGAVLFGMVLLFLLWINHHQFIAFSGIVVVLYYSAIKWASMKEEFEKRLESIAYIQQIESIYCIQFHQGDTGVEAAWENTVFKLKEHGNKNEVRVHLIMWRRPYIFTSFINHQGNRINSQHIRPGIIVNESFEEFEVYAAQWCVEERDQRRRELDGIKAREWAGQYIYNQN